MSTSFAKRIPVSAALAAVAFMLPSLLSGQVPATGSITGHVGLTEDEIPQASFRNPKISRGVILDERGFAKFLFLE
jgi:hypothetical protein